MLFYAALLFSFLFPQTDGVSLSGVVFDINAATVGEVQVRLEQPTELKEWQATTKADGTFRFERLAIGTYRLTIQKEGYFPVSTEVRLEAGKTVEFTIAATETLKQEIEVIARPDPINTDTVAPQTTVNDEVIQNIPYTGRRNFLNALALMPGVMRDNSNQIHIHGSRSDQIRYQLDGMSLTDASTGGLSGNIPMDAIESIDLDLTGYSAEFGKGSGGVVRVHSQFIGDKYRFNVTDFIPGVDFKEKAIVEFSPRLLFSGPLVQGKLWFMYSGSLRFVRTFVDDIPRPNNQHGQTLTDQLLKLQWNMKESHVFTLNVLHNAEYFSNTGLSVVRPKETTTNFLRRGTAIGLTDRHVMGRFVRETNIQFTRRRDYDIAKGTAPLEARPEIWHGNFFSDRRASIRRFHAAQTLAWQIQTGGVNHRLKTGVEFDSLGSYLNLDRRPFRLYNEAGELRSAIAFVGPDSTNIHNEEYGAFLLDRMVFNDKFQIEAGLRFDRERVIGKNNFAPRMGFSYLPFGTGRSKISGGIGLFYDNVPLINLQLPNLQRRLTTTFEEGAPIAAAVATDTRVSPALRNPSGLHWNVGWEHEWAPRWVSRIEYIQKTGHDQMRLAAAPNLNGFDLVFDNSGKSKYRAVEFTLDRPIRTNLRILASYIYSNAKARPSMSLDFPDPALDLIPDARVDWDTPHRFVAWGYFPIPAQMSASFSIEARSGFPFTVVDDLNRLAEGYNNRSMPAFFVTNASVEKEIPIPFHSSKRMAFRVGVTNLFNRFNPRFVDANTNSPHFLTFTDTSNRHFVARVRILKK
jgi:outer membrane receptor protein involved in Fe transport